MKMVDDMVDREIDSLDIRRRRGKSVFSEKFARFGKPSALSAGMMLGIDTGACCDAIAPGDARCQNQGTHPGNAAACFTQVAIWASSSSSFSWMSM